MPDEPVRVLTVGEVPSAAAANAAIELRTAGGVAEAVRAAAGGGLDGLVVAAPDAIAELHRQLPAVPLIALVGPREESATLAALADGADEVVSTPVLDGATIAAAVQRARVRRAAEVGAGAAQLRTIITQNADGIVVVDSRGALLFLNPVAERMFGRTGADLIGE
ncbi:MAG TPA: PAS domain S-box protein, partial [Thermoleophilaceae bacterium]|nr:PAS domain S-box protein [Thermoleophilaceae bacterium]